MDSCKILQLEIIKIGDNQLLLGAGSKEWAYRFSRRNYGKALRNDTSIFLLQFALVSPAINILISDTIWQNYLLLIPCSTACYNSGAYYPRYHLVYEQCSGNVG